MFIDKYFAVRHWRDRYFNGLVGVDEYVPPPPLHAFTGAGVLTSEFWSPTRIVVGNALGRAAEPASPNRVEVKRLGS